VITRSKPDSLGQEFELGGHITRGYLLFVLGWVGLGWVGLYFILFFAFCCFPSAPAILLAISCSHLSHTLYTLPFPTHYQTIYLSILHVGDQTSRANPDIPRSADRRVDGYLKQLKGAFGGFLDEPLTGAGVERPMSTRAPPVGSLVFDEPCQLNFLDPDLLPDMRSR
jgi:hypothetical protein